MAPMDTGPWQMPTHTHTHFSGMLYSKFDSHSCCRQFVPVLWTYFLLNRTVNVNVGFSSCFSICNLMFYLLQDLNYLERQAFNRFSCLHLVLKKIFVPVIFIYLRGVSENIMPNNIIYNYFEFCNYFV